jgi:hypothetical protein
VSSWAYQLVMPRTVHTGSTRQEVALGEGKGSWSLNAAATADTCVAAT